jgi:hypothetical protein
MAHPLSFEARMRIVPVLVALLLALPAAPAAAQGGDPRPFARWEAPSLKLNETAVVAATSGPGNGLVLGLGGVAGGVAGFFIGGYTGVKIAEADDDCYDWCGIGAAFTGAAIGSAAAIPLGVHLANRSRGNYGRSVAVSAGIGAVGILAAIAAESGEVLVAIPVAQIVSSVLIERATSR